MTLKLDDDIESAAYKRREVLRDEIGKFFSRYLTVKDDRTINFIKMGLTIVQRVNPSARLYSNGLVFSEPAQISDFPKKEKRNNIYEIRNPLS